MLREIVRIFLVPDPEPKMGHDPTFKKVCRRLFNSYTECSKTARGPTKQQQHFSTSGREAMTAKMLSLILASLAMTAVSSAEPLGPGSGRSLRLSSFTGTFYYTVEQDGYRIVATLVAGDDQQPIRFVSTLGPGERVVISVPRAIDEPAVEVEIVRTGDVLVVNDLDVDQTSSISGGRFLPATLK
jgi:hypothetical protein